ncbi:MAG TPA: hypothetical protein VJP80_02010 [Candidatus Saccharimonadales bacterium]|nr:hypothetical protein [Candidatus Saccharimonadales bacterium]
MDGQPDAQRLIDRIVYLASLVSEPQSVDTTLDQLRIITTKTSQPSGEDMQTLKSIQSQLEDYLVHKERLRSFTEASLRANVEHHFNADDPARDARKAALTRIAITIAACVLITGTLFVTRLMKGQVVLAFLICTLFFGLALVFQSIKKDLVTQLQGSVNYLMAATIGTGLFALNFPIIAGDSHLQSLKLFQHGGFLEASIPVYICYYVAFYLYARQLNVSIPWLFKPLGAALSAIAVTVFCVVVPHPVAVPDELYFDLAVIGFGVSVYFSAVAAVLGFMAVRKTTAVYSKSTLFLAISMVLQTAGNGFFVVFVTFRSGDFMVNDQKGQVLTAFLIMSALAFQYIAAYKSKTILHA